MLSFRIHLASSTFILVQAKMKGAWVLLVAVIAAGVLVAVARDQPVTFVFGDSLTEVGNNNYFQYSLAKSNFPWYGIDYENAKPTGRFTNGRTIGDIMCINLYQLCDILSYICKVLITTISVNNCLLLPLNFFYQLQRWECLRHQLIFLWHTMMMQFSKGSIMLLVVLEFWMTLVPSL